MKSPEAPRLADSRIKRPRILFVDDDIADLTILREALRKERHWDMVFACGPERALEELCHEPFQVVVSDMGMPEMDGAELLAHVKEKSPATTRFILSGQDDRHATVKAAAVAHQFLSKPCDAGLLRSTLERTCAIHSLLENDAMRRLVGGIDSLPSVPALYLELNRAAKDPALGLGDMADIVAKDPSMSLKVLQLVNSAYFGVSQRITKVRQAVSYLGVELLQGIVLTSNVFGALEKKPIPGFDLAVAQEHALRTARAAPRFLFDSQRADEASTAALVHDVGEIVMGLGEPDGFAEALRIARQTGKPSHVIEREVLGYTHAEVGAYLLGIWGLPFSILEKVAFHHSPTASSPDADDVLSAVHAADLFVEQEHKDEKRAKS